MCMCSGGLDTSYDLGMVLTTALGFLYDHPSETIILRIQKDAGATSDDEAFKSAVAYDLGSSGPLGSYDRGQIYYPPATQDFAGPPYCCFASAYPDDLTW
ncbi:uncharacterized protein BROUX77_005244 [Berkeleyomyces rouxiae]|uniref:uncharacterized protein n=1 Tax=Berkeleyomyces rouxiae TaxID=2035830 RepID=UPI003B76A685